MNVFNKLWIGWGLSLAVNLLFFVSLEGYALARRGVGDTLSESVWALRDMNHPMYYVVLDTCYLMAITMAWVIFHFRFQNGRVV